MSKDSLLLQPIQVGNLTLKNRIMFPPLTTGYEERDGSIGPRSLAFYERLAKGGVSYIVIGDVAPVRTASPTPKLFDDSQIPAFKNLADTLHKYDAKVALQIFHPEYDVPGVGRMIGMAGAARQAAMQLKEAGDMAGFQAKMEEADKVTKEAYAKLLGKGWGNYLHTTDFDPDDPRVQTIDGCYVAILEETEEENHAL